MTAAALIAAVWLGIALPGAPAQEPASGGDTPRAYLVTFGPGEAVWERFGHNALWIHDPAAGTDVAYHYGLFDMSEAGFLAEFLQGRMAYSMGAVDAFRLIDAYRRVGRDATIQGLALTPPEVRELQTFLEWNMRPGNRVYRYDYFRDNCSTRVRDALNLVLDGALADILDAEPTSITYRSEALALTGEDRLLTAGMALGLGPLSDQRLTRWQLSFIPMRLRDAARDVAIVRSGRRVPLVTDERHIPPLGAPDAERAVGRGIISQRAVGMLVVGLLVGGLLALTGRLAARGRRTGRVLLSIFGAAWGLLAGILGLILLALWTLTDHEFAHANENLLQTNPLALVLVVLVPLAVLRGGSRAASLIALALAALSLLGLVLHPLPLTPQANLPTIALTLPIHLGLLYALLTQQREGSTTS